MIKLQKLGRKRMKRLKIYLLSKRTRLEDAMGASVEDSVLGGLLSRSPHTAFQKAAAHLRKNIKGVVICEPPTLDNTDAIIEVAEKTREDPCDDEETTTYYLKEVNPLSA